MFKRKQSTVLPFTGPTKPERPTVRAETGDELPAMVERALDEFAADMAQTMPISPGGGTEGVSDRPLHDERELVLDKIGAFEKQRDVHRGRRADRLADAEREHELERQYDELIAGKRADLATLDKYQPAIGAGE